MSVDCEPIKRYFLDLQDSLCTAVLELESQAEDGLKTYIEDEWQRELGGGGISRVFEDGAVFDKAGVNFSHVMGRSMPPSATVQRPELIGRSFEAMGVSVVMHPENPYVPTSHMNVRFFVARKPNEPDVWWFGGGFDLTPYYVFEADCKHWHRTAKAACEPFDDAFASDLYRHYKAACDHYFYLKHRNETRGIGGLFIDDLNHNSRDTCFEFIQSVGNAYAQAYFPIVKKRMHNPFTQREKNFQRYRRGRYVEFNLVYDRGTLFGLQTGGRTESILMSLPSIVHWRYNYRAVPGSAEARLQGYLKPIDWLAEPLEI